MLIRAVTSTYYAEFITKELVNYVLNFTIIHLIVYDTHIFHYNEALVENYEVI